MKIKPRLKKKYAVRIILIIINYIDTENCGTFTK